MNVDQPVRQPASDYPDRFLTLGTREIWGAAETFGLSTVDRRQHLHIVGRSGTGKTTLLRRMIAADVEAGAGFALIDPHGDLAGELIDAIPPWRIDHVCLFDLSDVGHPIAFNVLAGTTPHDRHLIVDGLVSAFRSLWRDSWGPRLEWLLNRGLHALCEVPNVSLMALPRMLTDDGYCARIARAVTDPVCRDFWSREWPVIERRMRAEMISPVLNKVGAFLSPPPLRNVLSQVRRSFDPRFAMDNGRILIANLASGRIGATNASLMGSLLISLLQSAALSRADMPEHRRRDFHLYVDEFPSFATDAWVSLLPQVRKYRMPLTLVSQGLSMLPPDVRIATLANVSNLICFGVGSQDADALVQELGGHVNADTLVNLANHHVVARLIRDGEIREPFRGTTPPIPLPMHGTADRVRARSRERFATPQHLVEERLLRWIG